MQTKSLHTKSKIDRRNPTNKWCVISTCKKSSTVKQVMTFSFSWVITLPFVFFKWLSNNRFSYPPYPPSCLLLFLGIFHSHFYSVSSPYCKTNYNLFLFFFQTKDFLLSFYSIPLFISSEEIFSLSFYSVLALLFTKDARV